MQLEEVGRLAYFRCGVALECQAGVGVGHACTVVNHLYECFAGVAQYYLDAFRFGIDSVFNQFLDYGGRTLDYFSGGYLVGHRIGQKFDYVVHRGKSERKGTEIFVILRA